MGREAKIDRKTKETEIRLRFNLDGTGRSQISADIPFIEHMLTLMAAHGFMDMELSASGDTGIDYHHTVDTTGRSAAS